MESLSLMFKVLWAPAEAMLRVSKSPKFVLPLVILALFSAGSATIAFYHLDPGEIAIRQVERQMRGQPIPDELREQIIRGTENPVLRTVGFVFSVIGPLIQVAVISLIYFGLFSLLGREAGYRSFFAVTTFAFIPIIFRMVAMSISVLTLPSSAIFPEELGAISPSVFLDPESVSRVLYVAVSMIDVVTLWILVLLAIGFRFLCKKGLSPVTRYVAVFIPWGIYAGFRLAIAAAFGF